MQTFRAAMVFLKTRNLVETGAAYRISEPREQRFFLVGIVPLAANAKVLKRGLHGCGLFIGQSSPMSALNYSTQDIKEMLDPAMAVHEHPDRIVESAVRLGADL